MTDRIAHEPLDRPLRIVGAEVLLTLSQAYLVGITFFISSDTLASYPAAGLISILALAIGLGYLVWLLGSTGQLMAVTNLLVLALLGSWFLVALVDSMAGGTGLVAQVGPRGLLALGLATGAGAVGAVCGIFLPGPRRRRWHQRAHPPSARPAGRVSVTAAPLALPARASRRAARRPAVAVEGSSVDPGAGAGEGAYDLSDEQRYDGAGDGSTGLMPVFGTSMYPAAGDDPAESAWAPDEEAEMTLEATPTTIGTEAGQAPEAYPTAEAAQAKEAAGAKAETAETPRPARARRSRRKTPPDPGAGDAA